MSRKFRTANYEETLNQTIRLGDALPPDHLVRFVVDLVAQLDLGRIYGQYAPVGGEAIAPEILLVAQAAGVLKLGNLNLDGSKIHADASKSHVPSAMDG